MLVDFENVHEDSTVLCYFLELLHLISCKKIFRSMFVAPQIRLLLTTVHVCKLYLLSYLLLPSVL